MAKDKSKSFQKKIQETEGSGFGQYKESTGGGHPFEKGNSNTRTTRENGKLRMQESGDKSTQPRDNGGRFTYKSVNGQSIDPKYGPSRGKTVNPLLTGGDGSIHIDDVKEQFSERSGKYWDKYKDSWYRKSGELITRDLKTRIAGKDIWDLAKARYDKVKGEFEGESQVFSQVKKGKKSQEEAKATAKAKQSDEQQFVLSSETGGIKEKDKIKPFKKKEQPMPAPQAPAPQPQPEPVPEKPKQLAGIKYNNEQVNKALSIYEEIAQKQGTPEKFEAIKNKLVQMSPEQLDKQLDFLKSKGFDF